MHRKTKNYLTILNAIKNQNMYIYLLRERESKRKHHNLKLFLQYLN
jgi:hypothetical protein